MQHHIEQRNEVLPKTLYGVFTFLSCFLEVGLLLSAVVQHRTLWEIGPILIAFHVANLLTYFWSAPWTFAIMFLLLGILFLLIPLEVVSGTVLGVFLSKLGIQWIRNDLKAIAKPGEAFKALPRLLGFSAAFFFSPIAFAGLVIPVVAGSFLYSKKSYQADHQSGLAIAIKFRPIYLTMAAHSAHYFTFGYAIPMLFAERYGLPYVSLGFVYVLGWLGYYLIERIVRPSPRAVAWGHLSSALAIIALYLSPNLWLALISWTITGFGGGTVFMLPHLRTSNPYDPRMMDIWDNSANVIGLLLLLFLQGESILGLAFLLAAILSIVSAWSSIRLYELPTAL